VLYIYIYIIRHIVYYDMYEYIYILVEVTFFNQVHDKVSTATHYKATKDLLKPPSRHYDFPLRPSKPTRQVPRNHCALPSSTFSAFFSGTRYGFHHSQNAYTHIHTRNLFFYYLEKKRYSKIGCCCKHTHSKNSIYIGSKTRR